MIEKNKVVSISYELRTEPNGEVRDSASEQKPLVFTYGQGQLLELFELNLLHKNAGDSYEFKIPAESGYGLVDEDMVVDLPKSIFKDMDPNELVAGATLPMVDSLGRHLQGRVVSVGDTVRMDFNHPMAGKDLYFKGKVLAERDATPEELEALKSHHCSGCGSDCGGHDGDGCDCGHCH